MNRFFTTTTAAIALAALPQTGMAQNSDTSSTTENKQSFTTEQLRLGTKLAAIFNSTISVEEQVLGVQKQMEAGLLSDPDVAYLENEYPGIVSFMVTAMMPEVIKTTEDTLPELNKVLGQYYASNMNVEDLETTIEFYSSPTGRKMILMMVSNLNVGPMMEDIMSSDYTGDISEQSMQKSIVSTASKIDITQFNGEDREMLSKFYVTPAFSKMMALQPEAVRIITKWSNQTDPVVEKRMESIAVAAVTEYMDARDNNREPVMP